MQIPLTFMTMLDSRLAYSLLLSCRQTITITQYIPTILLLGYFHFVIILSPLLRLLVSLLRLLVSISHVAAIINTMIYEITSKENYHSVLSFTQNRLDTRRLPCPRIQDKISLLVTIGLTCRYPASHDYSPPLSVAAYSHSHPPPPTSENYKTYFCLRLRDTLICQYLTVSLLSFYSLNNNDTFTLKDSN